MYKDTSELANKLNRLQNRDELDNFIENIKSGENVTFQQIVKDHLQSSDMTIADLGRKCLIDRTYIYQIMDGRKTPGRDKVIAIALALKMDLHETQRLLKLSNNSILYPRNRRDSIIIW